MYVQLEKSWELALITINDLIDGECYLNKGATAHIANVLVILVTSWIRFFTYFFLSSPQYYRENLLTVSNFLLIINVYLFFYCYVLYQQVMRRILGKKMQQGNLCVWLTNFFNFLLKVTITLCLVLKILR